MNGGEAIPKDADTPQPPPGTNFARVHSLPTAATVPVAAPHPAEAGRGTAWHWYVDLKWVFAIIFTLFLILALAVFTVFEVTGGQRAESIIAAMDAPLVAQPQFRTDLSVGAPKLYGFLASSGFASAVYHDPGQLQRLIDTIPDDINQPNVSPAEARALAARGVSGQSVGGSGEAYRSLLGIYSAPMRFLSSGTHAAAGKILAALLVLLLATGIPMLIFSRRLGKVVAAGACLAVAGWLPYLLMSLIRRGMDGWVAGSGAQPQTDQQQLLKAAFRPFIDGVFGEASAVYRDVAVAALLFLAAAGIAYLILRLRPGGFPDRRLA